MNDRLPVLFHLKPSHYNEKVRWALDYKGIAHRRVHPMPGAHMVIAFALTRGRVTTCPVLKLEGKAIGDSTRIIEALEKHFPDPPLYPADPEERERALALEDFFDEELGPAVRCVGFWELLNDRAYTSERGDEIAAPGQGRAFASPAFAALASRRYGVSGRSAAHAQLKVRGLMHLIEDLLGGGDHLVGGRFTVADLTAAALLAPLIGPPGMPYRRPGFPLPGRLQAITNELRALPAGQWAIRTYERYRPDSAAVEDDSVQEADDHVAEGVGLFQRGQVPGAREHVPAGVGQDAHE